MTGPTALSGVPLGVIVALALLVVADFTMKAVALVQLVRTPEDRVSLGGRKWAWALIILFVNVAGWTLWLVMGKKPLPAVEVRPASPAEERSRAAADALYGVAASADVSPMPPEDAAIGADGTGAGELP